jgi:hypothetical protein
VRRRRGSVRYGVASGRRSLSGCGDRNGSSARHGRGAGFCPHALGQLHDGRVGRRVKLLAEQARVHPRDPERPGPVSDRCQGVHQAHCNARVEAIERRQQAPPLYGIPVIAARTRVGRERFERVDCTLP